MSDPTTTGDPFVVPPIKSPYDPTTSGDSDPRIGYPRFRCLLCQRGANDLDAPHYLQRVSSKGKGAVAIWICTEHINPELLTDREKWINLCDKASDNETKAAASETGEWKHVFLEKISLSSRIEVGEHVIARNLGRENANAIVNAHNAALTAEREKRKAAEAAVFATRRLDEQQIAEALAAEREKYDAFEKYALQQATEADNEIQECHVALSRKTEQLAAESEQLEQVRAAQRHMNACRGLLKVPESEVLYDAIVELQEQLSAVTVALTKADTQLAAEREKVKGLHEACRAEANHSRQLREQIRLNPRKQ